MLSQAGNYLKIPQAREYSMLTSAWPVNSREQVRARPQIIGVPCIVERLTEGTGNSEFQLVKRVGISRLRVMVRLAATAKTRKAVAMRCTVTGSGMTVHRKQGKRHLAQSI
ncbi:MAG: hypothetical protein NTV46_18405 [Verrucomicrobia bacterium]|nr:hypothetical protein [Verrucomicrobiota bacterium]